MAEGKSEAMNEILARYDKARRSMDDLLTKVKNGQKIEEIHVQLVKQDLDHLKIPITALDTLVKKNASNLSFYNSLTSGGKRRNARKTRNAIKSRNARKSRNNRNL
jgi:uncharacterized protein YaaN involved in tellurite resistance